MTDTWDDEDRAIARALRAEAPDDGAPVDDDAVADYEAVVALLPVDEVTPPSGLEDRVVAAALARRPAAVRSIDRSRNVLPPASTHGSRRWIGAAAAAVAAAAIIVVLFAGRTPSVPSSPGARIQPVASPGDLGRVLTAPGTRQGVLRTPAGVDAGRAILDPKGSGFLTGLSFPAASRTNYWLWLDTDTAPVRVGIIPIASTVHFVVHGDVRAVRGVIISSAADAPQPVSLRAALSK